MSNTPNVVPRPGVDTVNTVQDELHVLRRAASFPSYPLIESLMNGGGDAMAFADDGEPARAEFMGILPELPTGKPPLPPQAHGESASGAWTVEYRSRRRHGSPVLSDDEAAEVEAATLRSRFELGHVDTPESFRHATERAGSLVTNRAVDERTRGRLAKAVIAKLLHQPQSLPTAITCDFGHAALKLVGALDEEAELQAQLVGQLVLGSERLALTGEREQAELFHEIQSLSTNVEIDKGLRLSLLANSLRNLAAASPAAVSTAVLHELRDTGMYLLTRTRIPVKTRMEFIAHVCASDNLAKLGFQAADRRRLVEIAVDLLPQHTAAPGPAILFVTQLAHAVRASLSLCVDETIPFVNQTLSIIRNYGTGDQKVAALEAFVKTVDHYRVHGNFDMLPPVAARRAHALALSLSRASTLNATQRTVALRILMRATFAGIALHKTAGAHEIGNQATTLLDEAAEDSERGIISMVS